GICCVPTFPLSRSKFYLLVFSAKAYITSFVARSSEPLGVAPVLAVSWGRDVYSERMATSVARCAVFFVLRQSGVGCRRVVVYACVRVRCRTSRRRFLFNWPPTTQLPHTR
ncbi:unnamed protein product, partial [Ectocarpus sp. 12 AP-2014]